LELQLQALLDAVASPRRRAILRLIWDRELAAGDIAAHLADISWPAVSQNLRVLCDAGLISQRKSGHFRLYQANPEAIGPLEPFLRAMWAADLERLRDVVERDQRERAR
jgi:DNA-binding transcriptional ArsR family regulator